MSFGKSFLLSIAAFVGLNFIFTIIYYAITPGGFNALFNTIQNAPLMILYYLFGSILSVPYTILNWTIAFPLFADDLTYLILGLGYLAAPLVASILAGRFGESKIESFGGWALTAIISTTSVIIGAWLSPTLQATLFTTYGWTSNVILIYGIISCVINVVFYGFFALLMSKIEYY
jgi:hypothetical protein